MEESEFKAYIGVVADIGRKSKDGGVFFIKGRLTAVTPTHLFFDMEDGHPEAILLTEIARIQFHENVKTISDNH